MTEALRFVLGLIVACALHTLGLRIHIAAPLFFDPFVVLVIYASMRTSTARSSLIGTFVGLVQDALTGGLYGLHGFANTSVAFLISAIRQRFVIQQPSQVAVLAGLGGMFQITILSFLQFALVAQAEIVHPGFALAKTFVTGLVTLAVYVGSDRFFAWERHRREQRSRRIRLGL